MIRVRINKELKDNVSEAKKDNRPTCTSRGDGKASNPYHDKDGEFSTKERATSVSVRNPQNEPCKYAGQAKMPRHRFSRIVCGRKDPKNPNVKADYRCKDGSKIREQEKDYKPEPTYPKELVSLGNGVFENIIKNKHNTNNFEDRWKDFISKVSSEEYSRLKRHICKNMHSIEDLLKFINNLQLANKAELYKQDNKNSK